MNFRAYTINRLFHDSNEKKKKKIIGSFLILKIFRKFSLFSSLCNKKVGRVTQTVLVDNYACYLLILILIFFFENITTIAGITNQIKFQNYLIFVCGSTIIRNF